MSCLQVSLELGGKSPNIIFESADLEQGQLDLLALISILTHPTH